MNGLNGGTGFGPWVVTDTENAPATAATTTSPSGNGGSFISSGNIEAANDVVVAGGAFRNPAPVFDVYDNGNASSSTATGAALNSSVETASRAFITPPTAGGSFAFTETLHNLRGTNAGAATSQAGFEFLDASGNVLMNLFVAGGGPGYQVTDYNHTSPLTLFSTDAAHSGSASRNLDLNVQSTDTLTINILDTVTLPNGDIVDDYNIVATGHRGSTYADGGQILVGPGGVSNGGIAAFAIYNNNAGTGSDIAVNGLTETGAVAATPEPASLTLATLGLGVSLAWSPPRLTLTTQRPPANDPASVRAPTRTLAFFFAVCCSCQRRINNRQRSHSFDIPHLRHPQHAPQLLRRHILHRPRRSRRPRRRLRKRRRPRRMKRDVPLHLLQHLVNMPVQHRHRPKPLDQPQHSLALLGPPPPLLIHRPQRHVRINTTTGVLLVAPHQIPLQPRQLLRLPAPPIRPPSKFITFTSPTKCTPR